MSRIISIQLEYIFDNYWAVAVHTDDRTRIYHKISQSTWDRIQGLRFKKLSGDHEGKVFNFTFK